MIVLFDLDGTIVDQPATILRCLNILLKKYNASYSMDELRPLIGKPLEGIIKRKVGSEKLAKQLRMEYREIYVKNYLDGTKIHDGVEELLMELRKRKIKTGIITSKFGDVARSFLKDLKIGTGAGITVKKEVFENCGYFDDSLPAAEDTEFFLRITEKYDYAVSLKILINIYRENSDRLSKNFVKIANAYNQFLPNHFAEIDQHPEIMVRYYYKMMWLNYHLKDKIKAKYYYDKIPKELRTSRIMAVKYLYELFPLTSAFYFHEKLAG